jgi:hypothetical protein
MGTALDNPALTMALNIMCDYGSSESTVMCMSVTRDGVWIDDQICCTLLIEHMTTIYNSLLHIYTSIHSHIFTSRCLVAVSNGGCCPSSGFLNYLQPQLPASHSNSSQGLNRRSPLTNSPTNCTPLTDTQAGSHLTPTSYSSHCRLKTLS